MDTSHSTVRSRSLARLGVGLGAPFRLQTYRNLLYLVLAFPLGVIYFVGLVMGATLGFGLLIVWVGLPILSLTILGATAFAGFEAKLARRLVGVGVRVPAVLREFDASEGTSLPGNGYLAAITRLLTAPSTRTVVVLVLAKFAFGIVSIIALLVAAGLTIGLLSAPFVLDAPSVAIGLTDDVVILGDYAVGPWDVDTMPEALLVAAFGIVFGLVALNGLNLLACFHAQYTGVLLALWSE